MEEIVEEVYVEAVAEDAKAQSKKKINKLFSGDRRRRDTKRNFRGGRRRDSDRGRKTAQEGGFKRVK